jgi:hypothetical protein
MDRYPNLKVISNFGVFHIACVHANHRPQHCMTHDVPLVSHALHPTPCNLLHRHRLCSISRVHANHRPQHCMTHDVPLVSHALQPTPCNLLHRHGLSHDRAKPRAKSTRAGTGYEFIDATAAASRGLPVGHTPGCLADAVADVAMGLLIASARDLVGGANRAAAADFVKINHDDLGKQVRVSHTQGRAPSSGCGYIE